MSRKPAFWILLSLISLGGTLLAVRYFSEAFPIVTLDLRMDRAAALASARGLAGKHGWGPPGFSQAASFDLDATVQNYVELEVGRSQAFRQLLKEGLYAPYTWRVRHFKEGEANETLARFTPEGAPYGFLEKLREDAPGARLAPEAARALAEAKVRTEWQIRLEEYVLAESSQETRPGGRIDHAFVYERPDRKIGEGLYRLRLVVAGDKLTELTHFIKVPEAFQRRYEEMRSANNTIATFASFAMLVFYVLGGCIIGLFFLLRQRWVVWKKPLVWGIFIAFLNLLGSISELPLSWMYYDTALSAREFLVQQLLAALGSFLLWTLLLTLTFMAAESLTRRAFPQMIQLWKLWTPEVASSRAVLGRTLGGYLIVGFDLAFVVAVYFLTTRRFGWWTPSDVLFQPNVLATYFPWLPPIAQSLQAGFWEECLFRAVPLAGAALLGERFGARKGFLAVAFLLQALIFGAGHANYPSQPAYARVVELIVPSFVFGGIFLTYGLLPCIVSHFVFDVVWFSIPLFVSTARGIWVNQVLVVVLALAPLWVVLWARSRSGRWTELTEADYNRAWQPSKLSEEKRARVQEVALSPLPVVSWRWLVLTGIGGLALWLSCTSFRQNAPRLSVSRLEAIRLARETLERRGVRLSPEWRVLPSVRGGVGQEDCFVWQAGGREAYQRLMGNYLRPPGWSVRFARFEGDIVERAEEFHVTIVGDGRVVRVRHQLPESSPGPTLAEDHARQIARRAVENELGLNPASLQEVSAVARRQPKRVDWVFTFSDPGNYPLKEGQARLAVTVAGDRVTDADRFVFVPEEWQRRERSERSMVELVRMTCWAAVGLCLLAAGVVAIVQWSRRDFSLPVFLRVLLLLWVAQVAGQLNQWPSVQAGFSTSEPLDHQVMVAVAGGLVGASLQALLLALVFGYVERTIAQSGESSVREDWLRGISATLGVAGLVALFRKLAAPSLSPEFADYSSLAAYVPWLSGVFTGVQHWAVGSALLLLIFVALHRVSQAGRRKKAVLLGLFVLAGLVLAGIEEVETMRSWFLSGSLLGLLLWLAYAQVVRFNLRVIPVAVGVMLMLASLTQAVYNAFPSAPLCEGLEVLALAALSHWGTKPR